MRASQGALVTNGASPATTVKCRTLTRLMTMALSCPFVIGCGKERGTNGPARFALHDAHLASNR